MSKTVLMIGLASDAIDYSKYPQYTKEGMESDFAQILRDLTENGYDAEWCLTDSGETALEQAREALTRKKPDIVMIGAGVRLDPEHSHLLEQILNSAVEISPKSKFAFNFSPKSTLSAIERWS